ncbi:MAG: class I SAM-dependent methyltransferase [Vicinamibacterales bacterium]
MERAAHWNRVYTTKAEKDVSWFEPLPTISLEMLDAAGMTAESCVLDVGGGDSHLVDALAARGLDCLAVLDVSGAALDRARTRLGSAAQTPTWIEADVTRGWSLKPMDFWHDRAVFHFLTTADDQARYKQHLLETLKPGGSAIIATFAPDGPEKCSGLPVQRYSPEQLAEALGPAFDLREARSHVHTTPWGSTQSFQYSRLRRRD